MFNDPNAPVLRMIQRAAKIYKHYYGDYPETIGLDIFTRFKEWQNTNYLDSYYFREIAHPMPRVYALDTMITFTNIAIKVDPVTFSPVEYDKYRLNPPRPTDPRQGKNGVWCKCGEHEVAMDLILTERGYCVIIAEKRDMEARQAFNAALEEEVGYATYRL